MGIFFGTDGIRGKVNNELTFDLAYKCGNAVGFDLNNGKVLIGQDTRISGSYITTAFAGGVQACGSNVVDVGICPTAGIAYLTKQFGFNNGVVVSASHNTPEYNGIKIFDNKGFKLGDKNEEELEKKFIYNKLTNFPSIGSYKQNFNLVKTYEDYLIKTSNVSFKGLKIVIDASNGASYKIAPYVFKKLGANVIKTNCKNDGLNINNNCGSLHPENLSKKVLKYKADLGFAFDGDSDRVIACDEKGNILDGDLIIYLLAKYFKKENRLKRNIVVGTRHTNMGIELALKNIGIDLIRTDIGDKYVIEKIENEDLSLGGEKSGHIILRDYTTTGDGILTAIIFTEMLKKSNKPLSELVDIKLYPQVNIDVVVKDKVRIINNEKLNNKIDKQQNFLGKNSRIMVRVSGTENKIRIMVESKNYNNAYQSANELANLIKYLNY